MDLIPTATKFYVDSLGNYIGGFSGIEEISIMDERGEKEIIRPYEFPEIPEGAIEIPSAPADARQKWDSENEAWLPLENNEDE